MNLEPRSNGHSELHAVLLQAWDDILRKDDTDLSDAEIDLLAVHAEGRTSADDLEQVEELLKRSPKATDLFVTMSFAAIDSESDQPPAALPFQPATSVKISSPASVTRPRASLWSWALASAAACVAVVTGIHSRQNDLRLTETQRQVALLEQERKQQSDQLADQEKKWLAQSEALLVSRKEQLALVSNQRTVLFTGGASPQLVTLAIRRLDSPLQQRGPMDDRDREREKDWNDARAAASNAAKVAQAMDVPRLRWEQVAVLIAAKEFTTAELMIGDIEQLDGVTSRSKHARATLRFARALELPVNQLAGEAQAVEQQLRDLNQSAPDFAPAYFTLAQVLELEAGEAARAGMKDQEKAFLAAAVEAWSQFLAIDRSLPGEVRELVNGHVKRLQEKL